MHSTYQNYRGTTGKPMLTHYLKLIVTQLPAALLASLTLLIFTIQPAHADFRKALTAYQARDGQIMLKEVQDAVDKKNDDGLVLFLSVLERDYAIASSRFFVFYTKEKEIEALLTEKSLSSLIPPPWEKWSQDSNSKQLLSFLEKAVAGSSLESQYRLLNIRYINGYFSLLGQTSGEVKQHDKNFGKELSSVIKKGYVSAAPFFYADPNPNSHLSSNTQWVVPSFRAGHTKAEMQVAVDFLLGSKARKISKNEQKGLRLLKLALAKPDALFYIGDFANNIAEYYRLKKDSKSLQEAYLWSLVSVTNTLDAKVPETLLVMRQNGELKKVAQNVAESWHVTPSELDADPIVWKANMPDALKHIKNFKTPKLLAENVKFNPKQQPILSFHHFEHDYNSFGFTPNIDAVARNYLIDIYTDGRVKFALGPRFDRSQNTEALLKLTPQAVRQLVEKIHTLGFEEAPLVHRSQYAYGCFLGCSEMFGYNAIRGSQNVYYLTLRNELSQRTVIYQGIEDEGITSTFMAKVFKLIEEQVPTRQYRCNSPEKREYYDYCVAQDNKNFAIANQGENK